MSYLRFTAGAGCFYIYASSLGLHVNTPNSVLGGAHEIYFESKNPSSVKNAKALMQALHDFLLEEGIKVKVGKGRRRNVRFVKGCQE